MSTTTMPRARRVSSKPDTEVAAMPLWRRPGYLVRRLHQIHGALFAEECVGFDITPVQYAVLTTLAQRPDCDQNTLAQEVGLDRTNAADVVRRLARQGLVVRRASPQDRRRMLARLTPRGQTILAAMQAPMIRAQQRLIDTLAPAEREQFVATLLKLVDATNNSSRAPRRDSTSED